MKHVACTMLLAALSYAPALAIPGQTDTQVLAWGKGNSAFTNFVYRNDPNGPGYEYMATFKVDGHDIEFHAKPDGPIKMEFFVFLDLLGASPPPARAIQCGDPRSRHAFTPLDRYA